MMSTRNRAADRGPARRRTRRRPGRPKTKLKPERVQLELQTMPGWRLTSGGNALSRKRRFCDGGAAARYAASVSEAAGAQGQPVVLEVIGCQVTLTLQRPSRDGIDMALIDFARQMS